MSVSIQKKALFRFNQIKRQSFDGRVCDDLSEVILQYLPLEDKLRLEGVSKQFQRTIFKKQYSITIGDIVGTANTNPSLLLFAKYYLQTLETLLKKCPKINAIEFQSVITADYKSILRLIGTYCKQLVQITGYPTIDNKTNELFVKKFNSKSFTLKNVLALSFGDSFRLLSHVRELHFKYENPYHTYIFKQNFFLSLIQIVSHPYTYLKTVSISLSLADIILLEAFIKNNKRLEGMAVKLSPDVSHQIDSVLFEISKLKHLTELKLLVENGLTEQTFVDGLEEIATNCTQLKSFFLGAFVCTETQFFALKCLKQLKRVDIVFSYELKSYSNYLFQTFNGFKYLTHLSVNFRTSFQSDYFTYNGIDLPKLQYLSINKPFSPSDRIIPILSQLSRLETIKLNIKNPKKNLIKELTERLIERCKYIRCIQLDYDPTE